VVHSLDDMKMVGGTAVNLEEEVSQAHVRPFIQGALRNVLLADTGFLWV
jgi:hypothetical protein